MPRATTKEGLINDAKENYEKLNLLISKLNEEELIHLLTFQKMKKRKKLTGKEIKILEIF